MSGAHYGIVNILSTNSTGKGMGRTQYLDWINKSLALDYKKIELMCTGAAYCQFFDILFPDTISLKKVKFECKQEFEYINNFKVIQNGFTTLKIDKTIPIEKLVKGRFQDNFEFLQWFREFYEANYDPERIEENYNPKTARKTTPGPTSVKQKVGSLITASPNSSIQKKIVSSSVAKPVSNQTVMKQPSKTVHKDQQLDTSDVEKRLEDAQSIIAEYEQKIKEYEDYVEQMVADNEQATNERDFYFQKLRKIEVLCQEQGDSTDPFLASIVDILYETEEGFAVPENEGNQTQEVEPDLNDNEPETF